MVSRWFHQDNIQSYGKSGNGMRGLLIRKGDYDLKYLATFVPCIKSGTESNTWLLNIPTFQTVNTLAWDLKPWGTCRSSLELRALGFWSKRQGESSPEALTQYAGAEEKGKCSPLPRSIYQLGTSSKSWKKGSSSFLLHFLGPMAMGPGQAGGQKGGLEQRCHGSSKTCLTCSG